MASNQNEPSWAEAILALLDFMTDEDNLVLLLTPEALTTSSSKPHSTSLIRASYVAFGIISGLDLDRIQANESAI